MHLVYVQRNESYPWKQKTVTRFMRYIASRPGVCYVQGQHHGLFGSVVQDGNYKAAETALNQAVTEHKVIYRSVISFRDDYAKHLNLNTLDDWQRMLESNIHCLADGMKIDRRHFKWTAAVHFEDGHPHAHILFWNDDNNAIQRFRTDSRSVNAIRKKMTKLVFAEDLEVLYKERTQAEKTLYQEVKKSLTDSSYLNYRHVDAHLDTVAQQLQDIRNAIPTSGRLAYKFMPPEVKQQLNTLTDYVLNNHPQLNNRLNSYLDVSERIEAFYGDTEKIVDGKRVGDIAREKSMERVYSRIGNQILQFVSGNQEQRIDENRSLNAIDRYAVQQLYSCIFSTLQQMIQTQNESHTHLKERGEMSAQAKKDYRINHAFAGSDWEHER